MQPLFYLNPNTYMNGQVLQIQPHFGTYVEFNQNNVTEPTNAHCTHTIIIIRRFCTLSTYCSYLLQGFPSTVWHTLSSQSLVHIHTGYKPLIKIPDWFAILVKARIWQQEHLKGRHSGRIYVQLSWVGLTCRCIDDRTNENNSQVLLQVTIKVPLLTLC